MRASHFYAGFGLVSLSGCLWFLACTPFDLSYLAWVAAVPMLLAVDRAPSLRNALFLGWWAGVVETAGGFYWLIDVMQRFADFPWIAAAGVFFVFCGARALIFLLFTLVVYPIRRRRAVPMAVLAPVVMSVCEFVVPQIFPCGQWITQAWHPLVIQIAELTGPWGVTALLMMINGALYDVLFAPRGGALDGALGAAPVASARRRLALPKPSPIAMTAAAVLAAALIFGAVRIREIDALAAKAPQLKIGLVQPNIAYTLDADVSREEALRELHALQEQSRRLEREGAELVVWSEGAYPVTLPRDFKSDLPETSLGMIRRGIAVPMVIGTLTYDPLRDDAYNSALLLDSQGLVGGRYDKVRLLAFGEYIPGIEYFPWLRNVLPIGTGRFAPGSGPAILQFKDPRGQSWSLGPVICYEDLLPGYLRRVGTLRPNLLVNLTSDSWFGADSEPWEHLALAVFASVELRVAMVRAVNSGVSALIDPAGRLLQKTYADDPYRQPRAADGLLVTAPRMTTAATAYVRFGSWFVYLCMGITLLIGVIAVRRPPSSPAESIGG